MKRAPHTLRLEDGPLRRNAFCLTGPDASLTVSRLFQNTYEFRYEFVAYPVSDEIEKAAGLLIDPDFIPEETGFGRIETGVGDAVSAFDGATMIAVDRGNGTVTVTFRDAVVHGGTIGTNDTVLPRYPIRVHGAVPRHVQGTFNFRMDAGDQFYGLGDKGGSPDRRDRRFLMHNRDALGYRGELADPLYKSIPFVIRRNRETGTWAGIAITAPDVVQADFGVESQLYFSFTLRNGPYRYVLFTGDSWEEILDGYTRLTGRPAFPPAFTFGFLGSSMDYAEPDDAPVRVEQYLNDVEAHDIPCEGLYLSSGYYKAENGHRHTFVWNRRKFPDPAAFISAIRKRGYHVACNAKPGILVDHPEYNQFAETGALIRDVDGFVYTDYYWSENAAFWDFSSPAARDRWRSLLRERLVAMGVDGVWNDNNEFEIEDSSVPVYSRRSTLALQMVAASFAELVAADPGRRPWVITRSGGMGIQRYARTWSGDNASTWESMRANLLMGSSMGLTGFPFFGHDIGGFYGDRPDDEQFLRWCQSAVFQPRFVIHSWNSDGAPTELWSYGDLFPALRALVLQHYEFLPYTYSHAYLAHSTGRPIQRLLSFAFPEDRELRDDGAAFLYGDAILVLPIVASGETEATVRLPAASSWYDPENDVRIQGGGEARFAVRQDRTRYLSRTGSIVFRSPEARRAESGWFPAPVVDLYPPDADTVSGEAKTVFFEDDGSADLSLKRFRLTAVAIESTAAGFAVHLERTDDTGWNPPEEGRLLTLRLPTGFRFEDGGREHSIVFDKTFSHRVVPFNGRYDQEK